MDQKKNKKLTLTQQVENMEVPHIQKVMNKIAQQFGTHSSRKGGICPGGISMHTQHLEKWLNETLRQCEDMKKGHVLAIPMSIPPLNRYYLDRTTLINSGHSYDDVSSIYRSLYVNTVGFYQVLKENTANINLETR